MAIELKKPGFSFFMHNLSTVEAVESQESTVQAVLKYRS